MDEQSCKVACLFPDGWLKCLTNRASNEKLYQTTALQRPCCAGAVEEESWSLTFETSLSPPAVQRWWHQHLHNLHPVSSWGEKGREWEEEELSLQLPCKINTSCTLLVIHSIPVPLGAETTKTKVRIQP